MFDFFAIKTLYYYRKRFFKWLPLVVFLLFVPSLYFAFFPGKVAAITILSFGTISVLFFANIRGFNFSNFHGRNIFYLFLFYNFVTYLRGLYSIDSYSNLVSLVTVDTFVSFLFPFFIFLADFDFFKRICHLLLIIGLPCCIMNYIFPATEDTMSFGHNIAFFNIFILTLPFLADRKYYVYFILFALLATFYNLDRRSISINCFVVVFIALCHKLLIGIRWRQIMFGTTIALPLVLLFLGLAGVFNVFKYAESININIEVNANRQYNVDSRTSIYTDVFGELYRQNKMIVGLGLRGKTQTSLADHPNYEYWLMYKDGRSHSESGMLNFFQYGGFIGYFVYSLFLLTCAYYALFKSKNDFIKLLGCYVCFKYIYSFIEEPLSTTPATFYLFLLLGMCLNKKFGELSNKEIKVYLNSIFKRHTLLSFD